MRDKHERPSFSFYSNLVFFDCGVGRINHKGEWQMVNGMMRLGKNVKVSVTKKQATRLRRKDYVQVVVSRVYPQGARFEVVSLDTAAVQPQEQPKLIPAFALIPKQELVGTVMRVTDYGVFVDVNANRRGLLHIQKVADLYGRYINKEQGLVDAGLERGARIRVVVLSNEKKRLFLDFTDDVKQDAETERIQDEMKRQAEERVVVTPVQEQEQSDQKESYEISEEEAAAWVAYASTDDESYERESPENDDDYDEERDIEDALGLGTY
jgi:predicted RNA-binding protein with RPS1 domain